VERKGDLEDSPFEKRRYVEKQIKYPG